LCYQRNKIFDCSKVLREDFWSAFEAKKSSKS
jgi:hypothetical protein